MGAVVPTEAETRTTTKRPTLAQALRTIEKLEQRIAALEIRVPSGDPIVTPEQINKVLDTRIGSSEFCESIAELLSESLEDQIERSVGDSVSALDFTDDISSAVESEIRGYDFAEMIAEELQSYDFSDEIRTELRQYDMSSQIEEALDDVLQPALDDVLQPAIIRGVQTVMAEAFEHPDRADRVEEQKKAVESLQASVAGLEKLVREGRGHISIVSEPKPDTEMPFLMVKSVEPDGTPILSNQLRTVEELRALPSPIRFDRSRHHGQTSDRYRESGPSYQWLLDHEACNEGARTAIRNNYYDLHGQTLNDMRLLDDYPIEFSWDTARRYFDHRRYAGEQERSVHALNHFTYYACRQTVEGSSTIGVVLNSRSWGMRTWTDHLIRDATVRRPGVHSPEQYADLFWNAVWENLNAFYKELVKDPYLEIRSMQADRTRQRVALPISERPALGEV